MYQSQVWARGDFVENLSDFDVSLPECLRVLTFLVDNAMKSPMRKLILVFVIGFVLPASIFEGGQSAVFAAEEIAFCNITALSGPAAPWGIPSARGLRLGAEEVNENGGFKVEGKVYKWKIIDYDHKYTPAEAVKAANRAIYSDKARYLSIMGGSPTLACLPLMKENKILSLNAAGGGKSVTNPDNPLVFRYIASVHSVYASIYPYLMKNEGVKTSACVNPDDATGQSGYAASRMMADASNVKIIVKEYFERGSKDFTAMLTRVLAKKPDMIDTCYTDSTSSALICKQARELGYEGVILLTWGPDPEQVLKIAGPHAEKAYMALGPLEPKTPHQKQVYERFTAKWGAGEWDRNVWFQYDLIPCLTKAIVETQSFDPHILARHLEAMTWEGVMGKAYFGGSKLFGIKRQYMVPLSLYQFQNGKPVYLQDLPIQPGILDE